MARLLVSVMDAAEARAARAGGADIVDAKDPRAGALGAVADDVLRTIHDALPPEAPLSVVLGDAHDVATTRRLAAAAANRGAAYVKLGFAMALEDAEPRAHLRAAREAIEDFGAVHEPPAVIAVAYADAACIGGVAPDAVLAAAAASGARGVLLDTARKDAPRLFELWTRDAVRDWIARAHAAALLVAIAGGLDAAAIACAASLGADIVGVRGAACDGGRLGRVSEARVRALAAAAHAGHR